MILSVSGVRWTAAKYEGNLERQKVWGLNASMVATVSVRMVERNVISVGGLLPKISPEGGPEGVIGRISLSLEGWAFGLPVPSIES